MNDWKEQLKNIKIENNEKSEDLRYIDTHAHYNANQFENIKNDLNDKYEVPYTTMNVGIINGGSAKNSVPANCNVVMDFRIVKKEHIKMIKEEKTRLRMDLRIIQLLNLILFLRIL